jgi:hypothetical protein
LWRKNKFYSSNLKQIYIGMLGLYWNGAKQTRLPHEFQ